jgi:hypothetical protein
MNDLNMFMYVLCGPPILGLRMHTVMYVYSTYDCIQADALLLYVSKN